MFPNQSTIWRYEGKFTIQLDAIGYTMQPGHKLCLTVCSNYWPYVPTPRLPTRIQIASPSISIPILKRPGDLILSPENSIFASPRHGPAVEKECFRTPSYTRQFFFVSRRGFKLKHVQNHQTCIDFFFRRFEGAMSNKSITVETVSDSGLYKNIVRTV